ncbi:TVP38/TMEM64 family protein [Pontibacter mangrovi]|uniref:TVP38/TMEM64 family membrane protein n=1 Tax=Pontibacter mangrovi TaxID=2589816 RepID=A0A501WC66_9BACT|nr:TVP38/TMEM64 family protein [Pontibacter mangrovi]TPE43096.1 TVP38/TMEM64 family protein [Pontibacter mangrovi]
MSEKQKDVKKHHERVKAGQRHQEPEPSKEQHHTQEADTDDKQSKWPLLITAILIGCLIGSYFLFPGFQQGVDKGWDVLTSGEEKRISEWVSQFGFWGPFFIVLAMIAQMFLLVINVVALMLVAIIAYGPVWGSVIAVGAVLVASTLGYWIGRSVGQAGVRKLIGKKSEQKVSGFMDDYGIWAIIIARLSPFLSNDAVSFVAGLAGMGFIRFIGATLAGIVPLTVLLAWLGENNERLKNGLIWVSAISLALFIGYIIYKKYVRAK